MCDVPLRGSNGTTVVTLTVVEKGTPPMKYCIYTIVELMRIGTTPDKMQSSFEAKYWYQTGP